MNDRIIGKQKMTIKSLLLKKSTIKKQAGSSMVEVLVTVLLLAVGLLGVAGMQSAGLRQTAASQMSAQSQLLVQDLAEMIIAYDIGAAGTYEFSSVPASQGTNCLTGPCTAAQMAQYNLWTWGQNMNPKLPSYAIDIDFDATTNAYEIVLTWDENREGSGYTPSTCTTTNGLNVGCFAMLVEL
jgi:type IV pilus assembly protein PilV